jgi:hypothetical protein
MPLQARRWTRWPVAGLALWAVGCPTGQPPSSGGNAQDRCERRRDNQSVTFGFSSGATVAGDQVTGRVVTTISRPKGDVVTTVATFSRGADLILESTTTRTGQTLKVAVRYGALIQGIRASTFESDGTTVRGNVDGRDVEAAPANTDPKLLKFADGKPAPTITVSAGLDAAVRTVAAEIEKGASQCSNGAPASAVAAPMTESGIGGDACTNCETFCGIGVAVCDVLEAGSCVLALWGYAECVNLGVAACTVAGGECLRRCDTNGSACCPVGCDHVCCDQGQSCLNKTNDCCAAGQVVCGDSCCGPEIRECNAGTCCPQGTTPCGSACCGGGQNCADPAQGLCCPVGQTACGDGCCAAGFCAGNGSCCNAQGAKLCGGVCCSADLCINGSCCDGHVCGTSTCCPGFNKCCNNGTVCCPSPDDVCLANNGACCPIARACGTRCCADGQNCVNGACKTLCSGGLVACQSGSNAPICCTPGAACCNGTCCGPGLICNGAAGCGVLH